MKKKVLMAVLLGSACLAVAGCSKKNTETEKATEKVTEAAAEAAEKETEGEAGVETEAQTKTESAEETEADTEAVTEEGTKAVTEEAEADTEAVTEAAEEETEEELPPRPEYTAQDYVALGTYEGLAVTVDPIKVTEEEIDASIKGAITGKDLYDEQTEGTVAEGDLVNIDYEGKGWCSI